MEGFLVLYGANTHLIATSGCGVSTISMISTTDSCQESIIEQVNEVYTHFGNSFNQHRITYQWALELNVLNDHAVSLKYTYYLSQR